jgi:pteridine reductase
MRPTALVTGGAARVGRGIAEELARSGFDVAIHARHSNADDAVAACRALGADAWGIQADLGEVEGCNAVIRAVLDRWDALHVLVNNASVFYPVALEAIDAAEWDKVLAVNLRAPFLLSRGLASHLRAADPSRVGAPEGQHGLVVHLCDIGGERPVGGYAHYSVSKAGLAMLVKAMAVELAPAIRTVGVAPGQVAWPDSFDPDLRERLTKKIPLRRAGTPEDVARLIRFLALEAHYLNGVIVPVDGGLSSKY